jgi:hypothetical protein
MLEVHDKQHYNLLYNRKYYLVQHIYPCNPSNELIIDIMLGRGGSLKNFCPIVHKSCDKSEQSAIRVVFM